jgi:hypothetical protein
MPEGVDPKRIDPVFRTEEVQHHLKTPRMENNIRSGREDSMIMKAIHKLAPGSA